jgi:hypothetical protein
MRKSALKEALFLLTLGLLAMGDTPMGREVAIRRHLYGGEESSISLQKLLSQGRKLFVANFTVQDGAGRPFSKGTGEPLSDPSAPAVVSAKCQPPLWP